MSDDTLPVGLMIIAFLLTFLVPVGGRPMFPADGPLRRRAPPPPTPARGKLSRMARGLP
ncbi:hypothetical protein GCM10007859_15330 [Brevundimonas denitrificans]|uniref:Uncharacterized protein n=1 Tax=Brevundimonas denitrificans TaxID=1443434 RepID=A0ABQ6BNQ9_9CAUL|nr:hypothetical protein GCM10007859_15330 [Brevundimonas denitrificans]